jgi:membrane protein required for colicin V production
MDSLPFNFMDIALIVVILISAVLAFMRGFVHEVLSIAAWIGAIVVTIFAFPYGQPFARQYIEIALLADAVTGLAIFVVALVIFTIVSHAISRNVRNSGLGAVDRSLGLLFGAFRGVVLICAAYLAMMWAIPKPEDRPLWIQNARSTPMVERGAVYLASLLPASILEQGEAAAESLTDDAENLIDAGEAVDSLTGTGGETTQEPADSGAESDGAEPDGSGYNDAERNQMNQVIQSTE